MITDFLNANTIQYSKKFIGDWQKAIAFSAKPLVSQGQIDKSYINRMVDLIKDKGPYINIGPHIAMAHARPGKDVHAIGLSLLVTKNPINLVDAGHPVNLWFSLAATDNKSHLSLIQQLMELLTDNQVVKKMLTSSNKKELVSIINQKFKPKV